MKLAFVKYQGTGNDFVIIDNRSGTIELSHSQIAALCHRRFGVGADGLMLLTSVPGVDFGMVYYNSDGNESTMCGNGGRCMIRFAGSLGLIKGNTTTFQAIDGAHEGLLMDDGRISLHMKDVSGISSWENGAFLNTGSPHLVIPVDDVANYPVVAEGRRLRNSPDFSPAGTNVNFVTDMPDGIYVRTYERGVEDETLSCGTGVTAAAIVSTGTAIGSFLVRVTTPGGLLTVQFNKDTPSTATNIWLTGPAVQVFEGVFELP